MSSTPETVVKAFFESFNTHNNDQFLTLAVPGATWWISGPAEKISHVGESAYVDHSPSKSRTEMSDIEDVVINVDYDSDVVVDRSGRRVAVEGRVCGRGVGKVEGKVLEFMVVYVIELSEDCKIERVKVFCDHLTIMEFYGQLKFVA